MSTPPNIHNYELLQKLADSAESERARLGEYLANGALYSHFRIAETVTFSDLPKTIQLHCVGTCGKVQSFGRIADSRTSDRGWALIARYCCRNCQKQSQAYFYVWNDNGFWKMGQTPPLRESIDPVLRNGLGKSFALYQKAIRSRNFGFGIGSVSYLRRIVEDATDQLMDLLKDDKWDAWSEVQRNEFDNARKTYRYSQKIEFAAEKILPQAIFANGRDSFSALHDVTSSGLHSKTEDECIAIFDRCNLIFTRTFQILYEHKRERDEFAAQLLALKR
jgi:hypothetical protein